MSRFDDIIKNTLNQVNETASILSDIYSSTDPQKVTLINQALIKLAQKTGSNQLMGTEKAALDEFGKAFASKMTSTTPSTSAVNPTGAPTTPAPTTAAVGPGSNPVSQQISSTAGY